MTERVKKQKYFLIRSYRSLIFLFIIGIIIFGRSDYFECDQYILIINGIAALFEGLFGFGGSLIFLSLTVSTLGWTGSVILDCILASINLSYVAFLNRKELTRGMIFRVLNQYAIAIVGLGLGLFYFIIFKEPTVIVIPFIVFGFIACIYKALILLSKTFQKMSGGLLFNLNLGYKQYLKDEKVGYKLMKAFADNNQSLSNEANVKKIDDTNWVIKDKTKKYQIEEVDNELNMYYIKRWKSIFTIMAGVGLGASNQEAPSSDQIFHSRVGAIAFFIMLVLLTKIAFFSSMEGSSAFLGISLINVIGYALFGFAFTNVGFRLSNKVKKIPEEKKAVAERSLEYTKLIIVFLAILYLSFQAVK